MSATRMASFPSVITVILNTNRREDTLEALGSLAGGDYSNHRVMVLDNASTDGSVEAINAQFPDVQIIHLEENRGFSGNNNVGVAAAVEAGADWIFVLNEDTILAPDCITRMVEAGEADPKVGMIGPLVYHFDEPEVIQSAGGKLDQHWQALHIGENEPDTGQYAGIREVDWISGCALLVRRQVVEQIGLMDDRFFYYWDETDWCMRAQAAGWKLYCVSDARLWHKGVQRDYRPSPNVTYYSSRNWLLLLAKHNAPITIKTYVGWQLTRRLASWTLRPKWRHMREHRNALYQGMMDFFRKRWGLRSAG